LFFEFRRAGETITLHEGSAIGTQAWSPRVRQMRIPELTGLDQKTVTVVGAGSLGGEISVGLAKAGVGELNIFDSDHYDLNNAVRHVLPISEAGAKKASGVAKLAAFMNPFVEINSSRWNIAGLELVREEFMKIVEKSDLVIDATGSEPVARFAHDACVRAEKPLIVANLSRGAWGGRVIRLEGLSPCYDCFITSLVEKTIIDVPVEPTRPGVTPYGCSHPAASGAGFDVSELASVVTRRAVQELKPEGYPANNSDWILISFRDVEPSERYREGELTPAENCAFCGV
jgi:molybdopterin/thiamine biosynthesis adenylyltransferase